MGNVDFLIDDCSIHHRSSKNIQDSDSGSGSLNIDNSGCRIGVNSQEFSTVHFYANDPGEFNFSSKSI